MAPTKCKVVLLVIILTLAMPFYVYFATDTAIPPSVDKNRKMVGNSQPVANTSQRVGDETNADEGHPNTGNTTYASRSDILDDLAHSPIPGDSTHGLQDPEQEVPNQITAQAHGQDAQKVGPSKAKPGKGGRGLTRAQKIALNHPPLGSNNKTMPLPRRIAEYSDENRYLFLCPNYGRTNNQIISLVKMYSLAYYSRRTLVMTRWWHKPHGNDFARASMLQYFNVTGGPVRIIEREDFEKLAVEWPDSMCVGNEKLDTCFLGSKIHCRRGSTFHRRTPDVNVAILSGEDPVVAIDGKNAFYANAPQQPCMWKYITPPDRFAAEAKAYATMIGLNPGYMALHLRFMENKCITFAKKHVHAFQVLGLVTPNFYTDVYPMCAMEKPYYSRWRNESLGKFYVTHDMGFGRPKMKNLTNDGAVYYFGSFTGDDRLLIDFWVSFFAGEFVGNAMSTMSINVCNARIASGKGCGNLAYLYNIYPCNPHPDFDKGFIPSK